MEKTKGIFKSGFQPILPLHIGLVLLALFALLVSSGCGTGSTNPLSTHQQADPAVLALSGTSLSFGNVTTGSSKVLTMTATNSGSESLTISKASASSTAFKWNAPALPVTLKGGDSATISIQFTPGAAGASSGNISLTTDASNGNATVALSGTGVTPGKLSASSSSVSFGYVAPGSSKSVNEILTNSGGTDLTISALTVSGTAFSVGGVTLPAKITAGSSLQVPITFKPTAVSNASGTLTIQSSGSTANTTIDLSGSGGSSSAIGFSPATLSFGNVTVGSSNTITAALSNSGSMDVVVSDVKVSGTGFSISGITLPFTVSSGQTTKVAIKFQPSASGSSSGTLTVSSDATTPTLSASLSGTGVTAGDVVGNPTSLSFGNVTTGNSKTLSETVTNSGGSSVTISAVSASGTGFSVSGITLPKTLSAGQTATFSVGFKASAAGAASGSVAITSNAPTPTTTIALSATGVTPATIASNPSSLTFGNVTSGASRTLTETLTNSGGTSLTISSVGANGIGFSVSGITLPATLAPGESVALKVLFNPTSAGGVTGNIAITSNASNANPTVPLYGTGVSATGTLTITPSSLSLGSVIVGDSGSTSGTLTATGASVTVSAATTNNSGVFTVGGLSLPVTINAGSSVPFTITFNPSTAGAQNATLTVSSNASPNTATASLSGTGTAAPTHSVSLSWTASTSTDVSGYNVYRAVYIGSCGAFGKINTVLDSTTTYSDNTVTSGTSYCYAATAVSTSNDESSYSNIVTNLQIPTT